MIGEDLHKEYIRSMGDAFNLALYIEDLEAMLKALDEGGTHKLGLSLQVTSMAGGTHRFRSGSTTSQEILTVAAQARLPEILRAAIELGKAGLGEKLKEVAIGNLEYICKLKGVANGSD